jgi:SAM-dependent methyltransferase
MFHELAPYYDVYLADKDYRGECRKLASIARRFGRSGRRSWLDVGCGTGRHLECLRRTYRVTGIDGSPEMLRVARRRLPGISLELRDARTFRLGRTFDVVSCIFGLLGHIENERDLRRVFHRISAHLNPGGIAIVEPWVDPAHYHPGFIHLMAHDGPSTKAVRLSYSTRRGRQLLVRSHYLLATRGRPVRHYEEVNVGLLVPPKRLVQMMEEAGLQGRFLSRGLVPGRGLLVGVKRPMTGAGLSR